MDYLIIAKVKEKENKEVWKILKEEGFIYIKNRVMVLSKRGNAKAIEMYKKYLEDLLIDYDVDIKIIEI